LMSETLRNSTFMAQSSLPAGPAGV